MSTLRKIATFGTAAVVALSPRLPPRRPNGRPRARSTTTPQLDCGSGVMEVGSGSDLWSTFVDLETGRKYKPIAWNVSGDGFAVVETKSEPKKRSVVCSYDDGVAKGTVTVKKA